MYFLLVLLRSCSANAQRKRQQHRRIKAGRVVEYMIKLFLAVTGRVTDRATVTGLGAGDGESVGSKVPGWKLEFGCNSRVLEITGNTSAVNM